MRLTLLERKEKRTRQKKEGSETLMVTQKGTEWKCDICGQVFGRIENAIYHEIHCFPKKEKKEAKPNE
jgi:ribosomal protein L34E